MKVPFFSNDLVDTNVKKMWLEAIDDVISSESLILGESVSLFEEDFASFVGVEYGVATSNGLDGLILALRAAKIKNGDLVAVPSHTFIATHLAILNVGAIPYSIDVDENGLLDLDLLENSKMVFKAVIPVHMHGSMVDMRRLRLWARKTNVIIVEDASQAHGCERDGVKAGEYGDLSVFSLYPTKNLGALGDAGIIVTSNSEYDKKLRTLRNYGSTPSSKYVHSEIGFNNRLDTIQAAVLRVNLAELSKWNSRRKQLAEIYREMLSKLPIQILINENFDSVYHHFPILTEERDALKTYLGQNEVGTEIHYPNLASAEIDNLTGEESAKMRQGEKIARTTLSLPISQWHSPEQIEYVAQAVVSYFKENP